METKTIVNSNMLPRRQGHQEDIKEAHKTKQHTETGRQIDDHTIKTLPGEERLNQHEMGKQLNMTSEERQLAVATETSGNSDKIDCEYCKKLVERDSMNKHHREECEKVDRPRVQTSTHTIKVLPVQDKIENLCKELVKKLQEHQQVTERLQEQQQVTEQRLQEQQQVTEQRILEQQQVTEQLQEQQQVTERLQEENRNLLNKLNSIVRNQHTDHSQVWMITITIAVAILLALVVKLSQEQTVTQQESVNITQALNKSVAELAQRLEKLRMSSQADKEALTAMLEALKKGLEVLETSSNRSVHELEQEFGDITQVLNKSMAELAQRLKQLNKTSQADKKKVKAMLKVQETELRLLREITDCPGSTAYRPASSCQQILNCDPSSFSGYYWIASADGNATRLYCSMNRVCGEVSGGWMRVADLDMTNSGSQCPSGLREIVHPGHRLCGRDTDHGGCSNVFFEVSHFKYDQVCGKIIAFQYSGPDSFRNGKTIDKNYLDGISLTYGKNPRKHVWSFAAALDEVGTCPSCNCPCINVTSAAIATPPPVFVGNDYFCDTGSTHEYRINTLYADNPLWDGAGCGSDNTCCSLNNPPWFFKQLQSSTS